MSDPREAELLSQITRLTRENELLRQKLDALSRRLFGAKSEAFNKDQLMLRLQQAEGSGPLEGKESGPGASGAEPPEPPKPPRQARKERKPRLPENLPTTTEVLIPEEVKACPRDWRYVGDEVTEQIDFMPGGFSRHLIVRQKYVKIKDVDAVPVIAPLPESLLERSILTAGLLAQILVGKYCDHLPLYRQEYIFESRYGVYLPRQTMARWVGVAADWLRPIYEEIRTGVMGGGYVQIDETPIRYLDPGNRKTRLGYLWVCSRPKGDVTFHWHTSRAAACLDNIVPADFGGTIQCDGYSAYESFAGRREEITLAGCMAHARRYFFEALANSPRVAWFILRQFQHLYALETQLRDLRAGPTLREARRASESRPVLERIKRLLLRLLGSHRYLPQSLMGKAITYMLGQWEEICVYLSDGRVEIDNNLVENAIRPTALGKKNWLFIGDAQAGERSAIIYTIIECCRRRGINPYAYLRDVLSRLPSMTNWQIKNVTPQAWAQEQRLKSRKAA